MNVKSAPKGDQRLQDVLLLARDLCMGTNGFFAAADGSVRMEPAPDPGDQRGLRATSLARGCLRHGDAQGTAPFWSAEAAEPGQVADEALACVALPLYDDQEFVGLLGVIDDWLPDLNEEQLGGLGKIGAELCVLVGQEPQPESPSIELPEAPPTPTDAGLPPQITVLNAPPVPEENPASEATAGIGAYEGFLGEVTDLLPDGVLVVRRDGTVIFANHGITEMTDLSREELLGADVGWVLSREPLAESLESLDVGTEAPVTVENLSRSDVLHCFLTTTGPAHSAPVEVVTRPISSRSAGECWLVVVRQAHEAPPADLPGEDLLEALRQGIVVCDSHGTVINANTEGQRLSGLPPEVELVGQRYLSVAQLRSFDGQPIPPESHPLTRALGGFAVGAEQMVVDDAGGVRRSVIISAQPVRLPGETGSTLTLRDVTLELEEEARLSHLALHDALTGLGNRYLLDDFLHRTIEESKTRGGASAVIFLDLDDFKGVNDRFGHEAGDLVLTAVARRVQNAVRSSELVARLGGDEFVVACSAIQGDHDVELLVERLRKALAAPYKIGEQTLGLSCSIGWVTADSRMDTPDRLLARADAEMYRTKRARSRARRTQRAQQ